MRKFIVLFGLIFSSPFAFPMDDAYEVDENVTSETAIPQPESEVIEETPAPQYVPETVEAPEETTFNDY